MSQVIDNRIVELTFDNSDFEKNTQVSMNTLKDLNKTINEAGSGKGFAGLADSIKGFSLDGVAKSIDTISSKFGALEIAGITALANIVNKAVDAGLQLTRSLTIAPIAQGYEEYELKMGSIQTIMAGTGESLETVNKYLNELNTYADRTIYSFADMTNNIGKFTNQGVKLDDAVKAIQGIANEAAVSGANAEQASHAMYNFAQALSAGYVKLIDWKSIENAMMATKEFKEQLLETALAVGTVVKQGDKFVTTTTNAKGSVSDEFSAVTAFNDSLSYQWMTTEVLTKTLAKYSDETTEIGKKAFAAAQDVKTFTQLIDTLKEAVGSGWAQSFEIIFGDFNEAKTLWTAVSNAVGGFIDKQSTARNEMLETWDAMGGRQALIDGFANAWKQILNITEPIKKAFKDIFPANMGEKLANISKSIGDLMKNFKVTDEISDKLYRTFHGLFAILDIGKQAVSAMVGLIKNLAASIGITATDVLEFTASIGDFFTSLNNKAKELDIFNKIATDLKGTIDKIVTSISNFASNVSANLNSGLSLGRSVIEAIKTDIQKCGEEIEKAKDTTVGAIDKIKETLNNFTIVKILKSVFGLVKDIGVTIGTVIGKAVGVIGKGIESIFTAIENSDSSALFKILNAGLLTALAGKFVKISETISDFTTMFGGLAKLFGGIGTTIGNIGGIFDGLGDSLEQLVNNLKADSLLKIAEAVGILAVSAILLESVDPDKIVQVLGSITTLLAELFVIMKMFNTKKPSDGLKSAITGFIDTTAANTTATSLIKLAAAVLIMSIAMKSLSDLNWEQVGIGLTSITGLMGILLASMRLMPKDSELKKSAGALITFGIALNILAAAFKIFASIELEEVGNAILGMSVALMDVVAALTALSLIKTDSMGKMAGSVLVMGLAMVVLGSAFKIFASIDLEEVGNAILGFSVALMELVAALGALSLIKTGDLTKMAAAILIMSTAMIALGTAMKIFSSIGLEELGNAILGFSVALMELVAALTALSLIKTGDLTKMAASILVMSTAMVVLGAAMKIFGSMNWDEVARGLTAMALAMVILIGALNSLSNVKAADLAATAGSLIVVGLAITVMANAVEKLGKLKVGELAKGLISLAVGLGIMVGALTLMGAVGGAATLVTAAALVVLGAAIGELSLSLKLLSTIPLGAMAKAIGGLLISLAAVAGLAAILAPVAPALIIFAAGIAAIAAAVALFGAGILALGTGIGMLANGLMEMQKLGSGVIELVKDTLKAALEAIVEAIPSFISALLDGVGQTIEAFNNSLPQIIELFSTLITAILAALNEHLPGIIDSVMQFLGMLLDKLTEYVPKFAEKATTFIIAFIKALAESHLRLINAAMELIITFINGLSDAIETNTPKFTAAVKRLFETVIKAAVAVLVGSIPFVKTTGADVMNGGFIEGLKSKIDGVIQVGRDFINGFVNGVKEKVSEAVNTVKSFGGDIISNLKSVFDSHSPSRVTDRIGRDFDQGFINGVKKLADKAVKAAKEMGDDTVDALKMDNISSIVDLDSFNPVITPTLDLSYVQNGVNAIDNMLNGKTMSATVDAVLEAGNNNNTVISELKDEVIRLGDRIAEMQIVLDSGTMVGAMTDQIDNQLGRRQVYAGRGI